LYNPRRPTCPHPCTHGGQQKPKPCRPTTVVNGSHNVSRWMTWLPISLKNAAKCDKWYQLQNLSITESLNANGSWKKALVVQLQECHVSVSNKNQNNRRGLPSGGPFPYKADSLLGGSMPRCVWPAGGAAPEQHPLVCIGAKHLCSLVDCVPPRGVPSRGDHSRLSTIACDFVRSNAQTNQIHWNVTMNTSLFQSNSPIGRLSIYFSFGHRPERGRTTRRT
jgi:hypothetical protein